MTIVSVVVQDVPPPPHVGHAGERGEAAFRVALTATGVRGRIALDELRVRVRRNDAGLDRNAVRARLALVDELRREKAGR